jgi:hypothetical protein
LTNQLGSRAAAAIGLGAEAVTRSPTKPAKLDFFVAYIIPRNIWYVIPVKLVTTSAWLGLFPSGCKRNAGYFESYREAWHLMAPGVDALPQPGILRRVHAMACQQSRGSSIARDIYDIPELR